MPLNLPEEVRRRIRLEQQFLQPARSPAAAAQRARLVERISAARQEIAQIFLDHDHWNTSVRKADEAPIDPDPDGDLARLAAFYDRLLQHDVH